MKKKQNGLLFLFVGLFLVSLYFTQSHRIPIGMPKPMDIQVPSVQVPSVQVPSVQVPSEIQVIVAQDYTDTLKNVYAPPVRYQETEFRQLGYLTSPNRGRLPLFGRRLNRRDKWAYYTLEQGIKLPIEVRNRLCTQSPGCDSLSSGDTVQVEGIAFKVNLYESFLTAY